MISVNDVGLSFGNSPLFKNVSIKFTPGNCYGVIGANGAGKSTFLKILSGEIQPDSGDIGVSSGSRIAVLKQDQNAFDNHTVMHTVIMGHKHLYDVMMRRDAIYAKEDFSEEDGILASNLEGEFAELNGWEAEAEAATLLDGLGIDDSFHEKRMGDIDGSLKVRVLLAQALFGNPDILLLDEPTNNLDLESITWLEGFLEKFPNTVIVVSHDRHFLNRICTHIADIDFQKIAVYVGNYDFWYQASQLTLRQSRDQQKRAEDKAKELKEFIQRFASNASKSKQATSRKKMLDKLNLDNFKPSSRRFPYVNFKPSRECGKIVLEMKDLNKTIEGEQLLKDFSLTVNRGDKIAFVGREHAAKSALFEMVAGDMEPDSGSYEWGVTITPSYFPIESSRYFTQDVSIIDWLRQYTESSDESYVRGFLGRMLFSGDDALKNVQVLSGGEKVRCMLSKMMLSEANVLVMDDPTNHLDLEAITALNNALIEFPEVVLFTSHDHQFVHSIANRIVEITPNGIIDRMMPFDDYLVDKGVQAARDELYHGHQRAAI